MTAPTPLNIQDNSQNKCLSPEEPLGQRFTHWYNHGWRFLLALTPEEGERPSWHMETRYPLEPRDLWDLYKDPEVLLGLCIGKYSRYLMGDIDIRSKNHPNNNPERYEGILKAMEEIGLCRPIVVRSSDSGGLHVYWYLPYAVHSFSLALAAKRALNKAEQHYKLIDGQLELFPNPKEHDPGRITNFKSHRLPLQTGSFLLDWELQPISKSVGTLMDWADWSAEGQDMALLEEAMAKAQTWLKEQHYFYKKRVSVEQFALDLQTHIETGWTGYGQTNFLLWKFAMNGIIFERLQDEELVQYMLETALNAPGYDRFCRHRREIEKRVRDWAKCAQKYYYPYQGKPPRDKTLKEVLASNNNIDKVVPFAKSRERREKKIKEVVCVVAVLRVEGNLPAGADKRIKTMIEKSKKMYSEGFSKDTLYKKEYKYLWHPDYESVKEWGVNPDSVVSKYPVLPDPWNEEKEKPKERQDKGFESLQVETPTVGVVFPQIGEQERETERSEGRIIGEEVNLLNPSLERVSLIFHCSIILQILSTTTNSNSLDSLISANNSNSCTQELIDKYLLYSASDNKSQNFDKKNLLLLRIILSGRLEGKLPQQPSELEANRGACVSLEEAITSFTTQESIIGNEVACNSQQEATCDCGNPHDLAITPKTPPAEDVNPLNEEILPQQWQEVRFKLEIVQQAKRLLNSFCKNFTIRPLPTEREVLEQFLKHCLMQRSPSLILHEEAEVWFATHEELIVQIKSCFGVFWEYFQNLRI